MRDSILFPLVLVLGASLFAARQPEQIAVASVEAKGSIPEVAGLFDCIYEQDGKPYRERNARSCLQSVLSTQYFENGRIKLATLGGNKVNVKYVLRAKLLRIDSVSWEAPENDRNNIQAWLARKSRPFGVGNYYDRGREVETTAAIEQYYRSLGVVARVTTLAQFDYKARKADLTFRVTIGPHLPQDPLVPPYAPECVETVGGLDWSDVDDRTPIPLVEAMIILRSSGACFSFEKLRRDEETLRNSQLFQRVDLSRIASGENRQTSLHLRAKPIPVRNVSLKHYGLSHEGDCDINPEMALRKGEPYSRAQATRIKEYLKIACHRPGAKIDVYEEDMLPEELELSVFFHVVAYPEDELFIDGKKVSSPTTWRAPGALPTTN